MFVLFPVANLRNETAIFPANEPATNQTSGGQSPDCQNALRQLDLDCQAKLLDFAKSVRDICPNTGSCTSDQSMELAKKTCSNADTLTQCMKEVVDKCSANGAGLNLNELKSNCEKLGLPTGAGSNSTNSGNGLGAPIYVSLLGMIFLLV